MAQSVRLSASRGQSLRLGRYLLREMVSQSPQGGHVYDAEGPESGQRVALMVFQSDDPLSIARWFRDAALAARLNHPGIAEIKEVGTAYDSKGRSCHFTATTWEEGLTLSDWAAVNEIREADLIWVMEESALILHYAHSMGAAHPKLLPSRIILTPGRRVVLTGFGWGVDEELGTPAEARKRDMQSLALVINEVLTGTTRRQSLFRDRPLTTICRMGLEGEYRTGLDLAEDLGRIRSGHPVTRRRKPRRGLPTVARIFLAVLGLMIVLLAAQTWFF